MKHTTKSAAATRKLGKQLAREIDSPTTLLFFGDLGCGKTTMIQGLAEGLGILKKIKSPTFVFRRDYKSNKGKLIHLDLYRIETHDDLQTIEWEEILLENAIRAVEWAERIEKDLPKNRIEIRLEESRGGERVISITNFE